MDVAVALIKNDGRILLVFDPNWGAFTLPMTRRRVWKDDAGALLGSEAWESTAGRAAAEVLGRTCRVKPIAIPDEVIHGRSWRDGRIKDYHYRMFMVHDVEPAPLPDTRAEWLTPEEITDPARHPISETAFVLIEYCREHLPAVLS
jgi:hypothetical protein